MADAKLAVASLFALALAACGDPNTSDRRAAPLPDAQKGAAIVASNGCAGCHQGESGDATLAGSMLPTGGPRAYPPNLTPDMETGLGAWSDDDIVRAIREGVDNAGHPLCSVMPRFRNMSEREASEVVAYLRSLRPVQRRVPETECASQNDGG